jgi:hypothetical protein
MTVDETDKRAGSGCSETYLSLCKRYNHLGWSLRERVRVTVLRR